MKAMLTQLLAQRAGDYFPDLAGQDVVVSMVRYVGRMNSELFEFELSSESSKFGLFAKIPFSQPSVLMGRDDQSKAALPDGIPGDRPRVCPLSFAQDNGINEYRALNDIHRHFSQLDDDRFGTITMLDFLNDSQIIIMEKGNAPCFNHLFRKANRWNRVETRELKHAFVNSGTWLKLFHSLPKLEQTRTRHSKRKEVIRSIFEMTEYLQEYKLPSRWSVKHCERLIVAAEEILPPELPIGLTHGDFAPRNVLVDENDRVTVFDTQSRWLAPIYEDVAHFLVAVKAAGPHVSTQGRYFDDQTLQRFENDFLEGYFQGSNVPMKSLRIFESLRLLEWWASLVFRGKDAIGMKRFAKETRRALWARFLSRYLEKMLTEIEA